MTKSINSPEFYTLTDLLQLVRSGRVAVPEFQRDFVWTPSEVSELLLTIARRWPCGTFLLLEGGEGDAQEFDLRPLKNASEVNKDNLDIVVLDGQQRLTAVFHAFDDQATSEVHFIELQKLRLEQELDEEHIRFDRRSRFTKTFPTMESQADAGIIKVCDLVNDERFGQWIGHLPEEQRAGLFDFRESHLPGFREYAMPAIVLPRTTPLSALAKIFETINRTGQELKTLDLMVAKLFPHGFKLRDQLEDMMAKEGSLLGTFNTPGIELLKLISLWERLRLRDPDEGPSKVKGVNESDVLNLKPEFVIEHFDAAVAAYEEALKFAAEVCGAVTAILLPSVTMMLPVADAIAQGLDRNLLEKWFWATTFGQTYAQGANTQAVADARSLRAWKADNAAIPEVVTSASYSVNALKGPRRRNEMLLRGVLCQLVLNDAKDWKVEGKRFRDEDERLDVHHIFPKRHLETIGFAKTDLILNFTLLKSSTNQAIRDALPATVLQRNDIDNNSLPAHLVDETALAGNNLGDFLQTRQDAVVTFLSNRYPWLSPIQEEALDDDN